MAAFKKKLWLVPRLIVLACLALTALGYQPARAAGPWYVAPSGNDGNSCLLPTDPCGTIAIAIAKASSGDTVYVASGTYTGNNTSAVVMIGKDIILSGGWDTSFTSQKGMSVIDGQASRQGLAITGGTIRIENFTIQNGYTRLDNGGGINNHNGSLTLNRSLVQDNISWQAGGGIYSFGTLTLNDTIVRDNNATREPCCSGGDGAGMFISGTVTLNNSVVSGNNSLSLGSGIYFSSGSLVLNNSTVSGNTSTTEAIYASVGTIRLNSSTVANNQGNGITIQIGTVQFQNTIVANNSGMDCYNDHLYSGTNISFGYNLIETSQGCSWDGSDLTNKDPQLGRLQDNGGATLTQALQPGSPAINAGNPAGCQGSAGLLTKDQRGYSRSDRCDIGAYETKPLDFSNMTVTPDYALVGSLVTYTITLANGSASGIDNVLVTDILPDSLTYLDGSLATTSGNADYTAGVITWTGPLNAASHVTITFGATVGESAKGTIIMNEVVIKAGEDVFPRTAKVHVPPPYLVFVPMVVMPPPGILGHVTLNGVAAAGVELTLRIHISPTVDGVVAHTNTGADGSFLFTDAPNLNAGEAYFVCFENDASTPDGRLSYWETRSIMDYVQGESFFSGNFDIADVNMTSPSPGAKVASPVTFQWVRRSAIPSDSYQFELIDAAKSRDFLSPLLGYVDDYLLQNLPSGFVKLKVYSWRVRVNSPDGGFGFPFYGYNITFK
jgi:uncharacterized repeat protein (TIGR01451 family)